LTGDGKPASESRSGRDVYAVDYGRSQIAAERYFALYGMVGYAICRHAQKREKPRFRHIDMSRRNQDKLAAM
jgi:hypothetical protein